MTPLSDESDLERQLRLYETIVSSTPDLVYVFDLDHRFVYANKALLEMWGKTWDEAIGHNCLELGYEPWHAEMHDREIEQVRATRKPIRGEVPFNGTNGRRIYDYIFTPVFGEDGSVEAIAGTTRDVTERKLAEDAAAELYEQNREILESITDAFFALDRDFRFTYVNSQAETVLGRAPGTLLGRLIWTEFPGLVGSRFETAYRQAMEQRKVSNVTEYYPDHERWYQVNSYPSPGGITVYFRNVTDERLAEEQLRASERMLEQQSRIFSTTLSSITDFAYTFDREGRFTFANRALTDLLQIRPEEIVGKNFFDLPYPHELAEKLQSQIEQVFTTGRPVRDETLFIDPSGGEGHYEYIFNPVFNADNEVEIVAGSTRDVTERVRSSAALTASEERYRSIINQTVVGVAETDLDGRFRTVNDHLCKILGYTRDELLSGPTIVSLTHPQDADESLSRITELAAEGRSFNIEKRYVRKDGSTVWADAFVSPIRDAAGAIVAIAAVVNDISPRKKVQEELRSVIEFDEAVMDNMGEGLYTVDTHGNLVTMNRAAERLFGRSLDECRGMNMHSLMHYMHRDGSPFSIEECERREALAGRVIANAHDVFVRSDGTFFDAVYTAAPLVTAGEVTGTVVVFRDATEEMRARDLLRESESRFRLMADNSPTLVWLSDTEMRGTYFNRTWLDYTGRSLEDEIDNGSRSDVHPDDLDHLLEVFAGSFSRRTQFEFEYRLRRHDGVYRWMLGRGSPVITGDGTFLGYLGSCTDIDDIKRVESELRESEERIRIAVDAARLVTWEWDLVEDVVYWSDRSKAVMGETTLGNPASSKEFFAVLHIDDVEGVRERLLKVVSSGEAFDMEFRTLRPDGRHRWISAYGQITRSGEAGPARLSGVASDITERKQAEQELRESERKLSAVFHGTQDYVGLLDAAGTLLETNRTSLEFGPSKREDEVGRPFWETIWFRYTPEAADDAKQAVEAAARGEFVTCELKLNKPDGEVCYFKLSLSPILDVDGKVKLIVPVAEDITGEKKALEELHRQALLIELSQEPIFVWELGGGIVEWNHGAEMLYGFTKPEVLGRNSQELLKTEAVQPMQEYLAELERDLSWSGELRHNAKDGTEIIVESRQQVLESGGRKLVLETNRDITERKFTERILQRYRMLSERSGDSIWFLDTNGRFMDVNEAAVRSYGYTHEEFLTMNITDLRHADTVADVGRKLAAANTSGVSFETIHVRKDGTAFPVDVTANAADFGGERLIMAIVRDISERKAAENALRQSEERSQLAQEAGRVGIWDWDGAAGKTYWSSSMWTIYGEEPSDLDPDEDYWSAHLHPADRERVVLHIRSAREGGDDAFHDEFRIIKKDGSVGWIESTATIVREASGKAVRMYGVNIEITERKDAQDRIRLSENQLRLITNALPALIAYVDTSERYRYANSRFDEWFEMPASEIIGKTVREVLGRTAYRTIKPWIDKALSGERSTFETVLTYKKVGRRYVNISYVPDTGVDGTIHGYYALTHDLTDLKRSQDLLRTSEARLGLMMESLTDYAILSLDREGRIDSWNLGAELIFGYSREEALELPTDALFTPEDRASGAPAREMETARANGRAADERWHIRKDGSRFYASGVMIPLYVGDELAGYAKIATDLTERRRRAEELQRAHDELEVRVQERTKELAHANAALLAEMEVREDAERQRADLLGRLVTSQEVERRRIARDLHDQLGQRLTALRLKIESLRGLAAPHAEIAARVGRLQQISEQLDSEVSFLAWELRPTALDDLGLEDAVGAFVSEWARHFEIAGEFHSDGMSQVRLGHDVETHLYRITQEALNNIVKHAEAKHVTVMLEKRGTNVMLIIEDDGKGFDPSDEKITAGSSGGLGLVGMGERAMLINGSLEVESAPKQGTTIFVRVPIS